MKVVSDPDLDGNELSRLLSASIMGNIENKNTGEKLKLSSKVIAAGILNRLEQFSKEKENKLK